MAKCKFKYSEEEQAWICTVCGRTVQAPKENAIHAECRRGATFIQMAVNYTKAVATHIATGAKKRTDEQVDELLAICQQCDNYNAVSESCHICGCKCTHGSNAFSNKLRMQSQHCPLRKW